MNSEQRTKNIGAFVGFGCVIVAMIGLAAYLIGHPGASVAAVTRHTRVILWGALVFAHLCF